MFIRKHDPNRNLYILLAAIAGAILVTIFCLLMFVAVFFPVSVEVNDNAPRNFEECAALRDSVIQESYPRVCVTSSGQRFVEEINGQICVNRCGDGVCQEIVCLGTGCPCAETVTSCPQDCK